jgi:hypothetical protein
MLAALVAVAWTGAAAAAQGPPAGCSAPPLCGGESSFKLELLETSPEQVCARYFFEQWDSFWFLGSNWWHSYYRPVVCLNAGKITGLNQSSHWTETEGFYHSDGVSHPVVGGCVTGGCSYVQLKGIAHLRWTAGWPDSTFTRCANLTVRGSGTYDQWFGC